MSEYGSDASITGSLIVDGEIDLGSGDDNVDVDAGTLYIDAANNRVGIGTETPEAYLDIKNTTDDGSTNRTMIQLYNYRADDADENDWAPTSIDFKIENVAGGVKGATARIATVIAPVGTGHNTTEGERSSALIFSTMDDNTLAEAMRINNEGHVDIGTTSPSTSAILELSSSDHGLMLPRVLEASKPTATSALNGLMVYEEDTHRLKIVANGEWQTISYE